MASVTAIGLVEQGFVPDRVSRVGIRRLLRERIAELAPDDCEQVAARVVDFVEMMDHSPVAPLPEKANEQHYELPPGFFERVLGDHLKYSSGYWSGEVDGLSAAEAALFKGQAELGLRRPEDAAVAHVQVR